MRHASQGQASGATSGAGDEPQVGEDESEGEGAGAAAESVPAAESESPVPKKQKTYEKAEQSQCP